ncbi:MAG: hypothetical protein AVDCRST_MAG53-1326, partial [uncultured Solirubrobacteraceae bacterium]
CRAPYRTHRRPRAVRRGTARHAKKRRRACCCAATTPGRWRTACASSRYS